MFSASVYINVCICKNEVFMFAFVIHLQPKIRAIMLQNEYEVNHIFMTTVSVGEIKTLCSSFGKMLNTKCSMAKMSAMISFARHI